MKTSSRLLIILAAIVLFGAGALTGSSLIKKQNNVAPVSTAPVSDQSWLISVLIDTGADLLGFNKVEIFPNDTVWSVLERLPLKVSDLDIVSEQYQDMGVLVKSIKGFTNGTGDQYWQYWVNNKYAEVAADKQPVKDDDVIMWKFTKAQFKEY